MTAGTGTMQKTLCRCVFLKLYRSAVAFESPEHLKNWLIRVTVNECRADVRLPLEAALGMPGIPSRRRRGLGL